MSIGGYMRTSPPAFWLTIVSKKRFGIPQILGRGFESQIDLNSTLVACKASGARVAFAGPPRKTEATVIPFRQRTYKCKEHYGELHIDPPVFELYPGHVEAISTVLPEASIYVTDCSEDPPPGAA
jgi:hypothetical protein